jgi:hypothetical protein
MKVTHIIKERSQGEEAGGEEFVWEEPEACSDSVILSEEPALFSDSASSLSRTEVSCESSWMTARSDTSPLSWSGGREERTMWSYRQKSKLQSSDMKEKTQL